METPKVRGFLNNKKKRWETTTLRIEGPNSHPQTSKGPKVPTIFPIFFVMNFGEVVGGLKMSEKIPIGFSPKKAPPKALKLIQNLETFRGT